MLQEIFNQRETIALASFFLSFSYLFILFVSILVCGQFSADYAFLMDASGSILPPEFDILKRFVKQVIDDVGREDFHTQPVGHLLCFSLYPHIKGQNNGIPRMKHKYR